MTTYCSCGEALSEEADFCFVCGKPAPGLQATNAHWEVCQVCLTDESYYHDTKFYIECLCFCARAHGPKGEYIAARSLGFKPQAGLSENDLPARQAMEGLRRRLETTGWQRICHGNEWYCERYHRSLVATLSA
jgi:hypothetical protein